MYKVDRVDAGTGGLGCIRGLVWKGRLIRVNEMDQGDEACGQEMELGRESLRCTGWSCICSLTLMNL